MTELIGLDSVDNESVEFEVIKNENDDKLSPILSEKSFDISECSAEFSNINIPNDESDENSIPFKAESILNSIYSLPQSSIIFIFLS